MKRHSAWLTDLKALLGGVVVLAVIFVAAAIALPRLGVVPGDAPSTQSVAPSGDGLPAAVGANRADPPAMGAQEAEITPPAPSSADVQPPQTDAAAEDEELAAPAGLGERGGQGAQRGEGGFPLGDGTPRFPGGEDGAPPVETIQAEATPEPDIATTTPAVETPAAPSGGEVRSIALAGALGADLYDRPQGSAHASLPAGAVLTAIGRSADGGWLLVQSEDAAGWAEIARLVIFDTAGLPVLPAGDEALIDEGLVVEAAPEDAPAVSPDAAGEDARAPEAAPIQAAIITATVITEDARLNVRAGPGSGYAIVTKADPREQFIALARSAGDTWIMVALPATADGFGWVSAEFVTLSAPAAGLPVSDETGSADMVTKVAMTAAPVAQVSASDSAPAADTSSGGAGLRGTLVFEESNGGTIYAYDLESGSIRSLTYGFDPAISPDGSTVAFTRDGGENGLYLIDSDGDNQRLIYSGRQRLASPKWSPDGSQIVFSRGDEVLRCYMLGPFGCIPEEEADDIVGPDGKKIELDPDLLISQISYKLSVVDTNGDDFHDLATLSSARTPDWIEAGVVYQSDAGLQITADEPNAENRLVIFDYLKPFFHDPDWQPGGGAIVYQGKEASHWEIFKVNPDGTGKVALTKPATTLVDELPSNVAPAWSPDGESIVFLSNRSEGGSAGPWRLWVMDADGSNQRPLPIDIPLTYSFGDEQQVSWGP